MIALYRVGVQIELDEELDDGLVLTLQLLEETAEQRGADHLVGAKKLRRGAIEGQLAQTESRTRFVDLRRVQRAAGGLDPVVGVLEIDLIRQRPAEPTLEHGPCGLVIGPHRLETV